MRVFERVIFLALLLPAARLTAGATDRKAMELVHDAIDAQGGEQKLRALQNVQFDVLGYRNMLEQSERPEGPQ